ncbi:hypothetical protein D3C78_1114110 [compost metagenome]
MWGLKPGAVQCRCNLRMRAYSKARVAFQILSKPATQQAVHYWKVEAECCCNGMSFLPGVVEDVAKQFS